MIVVKPNPQIFIRCISFKLFNLFNIWKLYSNQLLLRLSKELWCCPKLNTKKFWFLIWMKLWFIVLMILLTNPLIYPFQSIFKLEMLLRLELILGLMLMNVLSRHRKIIKLLSLQLAIKHMPMLSLIL